MNILDFIENDSIKGEVAVKDQIFRGLKKLPSHKKREIVVLYALGYDRKEVAEITGYSYPSICKILSSAS